MSTMLPARPRIAAALVFAFALAFTACDAPDRPVGPTQLPASPALAASPASVLAPSQGYRKAITPAAIRVHEAAFQAIADQNSGFRSSFDASHTASATYVRDLMLAAGYNVTVQPFTFDFGGDITPPTFARVVPNPTTFTRAVDFNTMAYSGSGDVTAEVYNVNLFIPSTGNSTSGCEATDFIGFPPGRIALVQRGTCEFRTKVANATAAGAVAVIIMNEGNTPAREPALSGTLFPASVTVPVIGTSYAIGVSLANSVVTPVVRIKVNAAAGTQTSSNVIAETPGGNANSVVVVAANLDGRFGPGINASSGGAAMVELARVFASQERMPNNRIRFIWFGAYAEGLHGATYYVANLTTDEKSRIKAAIDLQPLGSPNFGRFVVDGDQVGFPVNPVADAGSNAIEAMFADYFTASGLAFSTSQGVQNAGSFRNEGIPFGGITSGLGTTKTAQEVALFGGTAGVAFDPCVLQLCDSYANVSLTALDQMSDAAAHVVLALSKRNFAQKPLAGN